MKRQAHATQRVVIVAMLLAGCGANRGLTGSRSGGMLPKHRFWPPPQSTALWAPRADRLRELSLAQVGDNLRVALHRRGYVELRWFPIGAEFSHGFAVTTRLEQLTAEKAADSERWLSQHPEAANLFWLSQATTVSLPRPGRYRVLLLAITDLPIGPSPIAPIWGRDTVMAGPNVPESRIGADLPADRHLESARLGVYTYVYEKGPKDYQGRLLSREVLLRPEEHPPHWLADCFASAASSLSVRDPHPSR